MKNHDVFPWRFRRRLSLLLRPLVQIRTGSDKEWLVFPPALDTTAKYLLGNVGEAAFPVEHFESKEMQQFWGDQVNRQGHRFTQEVAEVFEKRGFRTRREVLMRTLGVTESEGDFGDVDVVAWRDNAPLVFPVECKRLRDATSVRDVVDRLKEYRGEVGDSLGKHLQRVNWLKMNREKLKQSMGCSLPQIEIRMLLVTSDLVPMQFFSGASLKSDEVVSIDLLPQYLAWI